MKIAKNNANSSSWLPTACAMFRGKARLGACALAVLLVGKSASAQWATWEVSDGGNGHSYQAVSGFPLLTWDVADQLARAQGGYLATITSPAENSFVFNLIDSPEFWNDSINGSGPAIGGIQLEGSEEPAGGWKWVTDEPWTYTNWLPGQPDNGAGGFFESRLHFFSGFEPGIRADTWNDIAGDDFNLGGFVIEAVPEPGTLALLGLSAVMVRRRRSRRLNIALRQAIRVSTLCPRGSATAVAFALVTLYFGALALGQVPTITNLGVLPGGTASYANAVSADGSAVAGTSGSTNGDHAFRWTAAGLWQDLGTLTGGESSVANAISADGLTVAGTSESNDGLRAFRWSAVGGMQNLGALEAGSASDAIGINADGSIVAGSVGGMNGTRFFRWTIASGMQDLGFWGFYSHCYGISADGTTVVGYTYVFVNGEFLEAPVRWTDTNGLGFAGDVYGIAKAANSDGSVVAGIMYGSYDDPAFRWTAKAGAQSIGTLPGYFSADPSAISGDGLFVAGSANNYGSNPRAFLWTAALEMMDLNTYLSSKGLDLAGWVLTDARGLSFDGSIIVGNGKYNGQERAWMVKIPHAGDITGDGHVNIADLLAVLGAWGPCPSPCPADIAPAPNGDGQINVGDLLRVISNWE